MINIVCIKWGTKFSSAHVNILYRSVKNHLTQEHNFLCFTDNAIGLDPAIYAQPFWRDYAELGLNYRKLKLYSDEILSLLDYNILYLDLDTVITGTMLPFANLNQNTIWKSPSNGRLGFVYNTSFVRLVDNEFCSAWKKFKKNHQQLIHDSKIVDGWTGSDQAIISHLFGATSNHVDESDGIISLRDHAEICSADKLKRGTKIVSFYHNDKYGDMSDEALQEKHPWIVQHWLSYADEADLLILKNLKEGELVRESSNTIIKRPLKKQVFNRNYIRDKRLHKIRESRITKK